MWLFIPETHSSAKVYVLNGWAGPPNACMAQKGTRQWRTASRCLQKKGTCHFDCDQSRRPVQNPVQTWLQKNEVEPSWLHPMTEYNYSVQENGDACKPFPVKNRVRQEESKHTLSSPLRSLRCYWMSTEAVNKAHPSSSALAANSWT